MNEISVKIHAFIMENIIQKDNFNGKIYPNAHYIMQKLYPIAYNLTLFVNFIPDCI